uniref:Small nuclear ribonucleoprotein n=1 Tax=Bigelowiella natans TaxID=227086 RepID=Q5YES2_BIGNA|nr:small nuclear ribonucleoprotein [Bigelowiella natans]|mmetsp:Transcript_46878/g.75351  ORF Transcript_46878/g.75351 Transcript_46878/m.75351 type:complete len:228 (-) Transcript_46878:30-713(-)|eukprot:jgi/Bigna1/55336/estExt_Genewise1Plus.C_560041
MSNVYAVRPNQTIYIQNLNEKLKRDELRINLYHAFSQFGNILEVFASKKGNKRGQAWIVFDDLSGATKSVRGMQNVDFFGKKMRLSYAKEKSDIISKRDGSYVPREKRKMNSGDMKIEPKVQKTTAVATAKGEGAPAMETDEPEEEDSSPPNKILFARNLPPQATKKMLETLFKQYDGFKEVRLVDGKPDIAFIEFNDAQESALAKEGLQNFKITSQNAMKLTFAKQ